MKKYFDQLRPGERRLVIGVGVVLILVVNYVYVWPHFSDWGRLTDRLDSARTRLTLYQTAVKQKPDLEKSVKHYQTEGQFVALADQAVNFMRSIQQQASASGFGIQDYSPSIMRTNDAFFVEQQQTIRFTATEEQIVDFLYKLGSGPSMVRVRDLELQPDSPHQRLNANIKLIANYQKNPTPATADKNSTAKPK
jgi:Tfp pilus assembly protein PilO